MSATEITQAITEKQPVDLGILLLNMEARIVEQFKEVIQEVIQDLWDRVDGIYDDVGQMMQSMEKQEKSIHTLHLKMEKQFDQLDSFESQQRKLKAQLQQQDTRNSPPQPSRYPWVSNRGAYRGKEYRGGRQQEYRPSYDPDYRKPETTYQRPQYDSSSRYRPDFEPNHCYRSDYDSNQRYRPDYGANKPYRPDYDNNQRDYPEFEPNQRFQKKEYIPSYSPKTDSYRENFDGNGFDRFQGDTGSITSEIRNGGGSMSSTEQQSFQPNSFGKKQNNRSVNKDRQNYQDDDGTAMGYDRDWKGDAWDNQQAEFTSIRPTTTSSDLHTNNSQPVKSRFTPKKGGFGYFVQQNSDAQPMHQPSSNHHKWGSKKTVEANAENHLEDSTENKEKQDNQLSISPAASISSPIPHEDSSTKPRFSGGFGQSTKTGGFGCAAQKSATKDCFLQLGGNLAVQEDGYDDHDGLLLNTENTALESISEDLNPALDESLQADTVQQETSMDEDRCMKEPDTEHSNQSATNQETVIKHLQSSNISGVEQDQEDQKNSDEVS